MDGKVLVKFTVNNLNPVVLNDGVLRNISVLPRLGEVLKLSVSPYCTASDGVNYVGSYKIIRIEHAFESQGTRHTHGGKYICYPGDITIFVEPTEDMI